MSAYIYTVPETLSYKLKNSDGTLAFDIDVKLNNEVIHIQKPGKSGEKISVHINHTEQLETIFKDARSFLNEKEKENDKE